MSADALRWYWQNVESVEASHGVSTATKRHALLIISMRAIAEDNHTAALTAVKLATLMGVHRNQATKTIKALKLDGLIVGSYGSIRMCSDVSKVHSDSAFGDVGNVGKTHSESATMHTDSAFGGGGGENEKHTQSAFEKSEKHTQCARKAHSECTHIINNNNKQTTKRGHAHVGVGTHAREGLDPSAFRSMASTWHVLMGYSEQIISKAEADITKALRLHSAEAVAHGLESIKTYIQQNPGVRPSPKWLIDRAGTYQPAKARSPIEQAHESPEDQEHVKAQLKAIQRLGGKLAKAGGNR